MLAEKGLQVSVDASPAGTLKSIFSHKVWQLTDGNIKEEENWQWIDRSDYDALPWAGPHGKITAMV